MAITIMLALGNAAPNARADAGVVLSVGITEIAERLGLLPLIRQPPKAMSVPSIPTVILSLVWPGPG